MGSNAFGWRDIGLALASVLLVFNGYLRSADNEQHAEYQRSTQQQFTALERKFDERCAEMSRQLTDLRAIDENSRARIGTLESELAETRAEVKAHDRDASRYKDKIERVERCCYGTGMGGMEGMK